MLNRTDKCRQRADECGRGAGRVADDVHAAKGRSVASKSSPTRQRRGLFFDRPRCREAMRLMSALGQKQTLKRLQSMSAFPPIADIGTQSWYVRIVPIADIGTSFDHFIGAHK
jgi:hypothetical protein